VPEEKQSYSRYEPRKFEAAGLTPMPSAVVRPPRVDGCDLQLEARLIAARPAGPDRSFLLLETEIVYTHAHERIVVPGTDHIDPHQWQPLLYNYRHYFGLGPERGRSFRAQV
jgi:flavin reductase (DIM6/NTAB) family NADH-FMN oxidoreductase RutF